MSIQKASFDILPRELRHQILGYTALIHPKNIHVVCNGRLVSGINFIKVQDGQYSLHSWSGPGYPRDFEGNNILNVRNKALREDAHYILFTRNEVKFYQYHLVSFLEFLKRKQRYVHYIRRLSFEFHEGHLEYWTASGGERLLFSGWRARFSRGSPTLDKTWIELVEFIKSNIPLDTLHIVVDA